MHSSLSKYLEEKKNTVFNVAQKFLVIFDQRVLVIFDQRVHGILTLDVISLAVQAMQAN